MKTARFAFTALALTFAAGIHAQSSCVGSGALRTCTDAASGNVYTTSRIGSTSLTTGSNVNTGTTWSQNTQRVGDTSFTNGTNSRGDAWNSSTQRIGDTSITTGSDSRGRNFNVTTQRIGDSTLVNATDSKGNVTTKVCNQYGCF